MQRSPRNHTSKRSRITAQPLSGMDDAAVVSMLMKSKMKTKAKHINKLRLATAVNGNGAIVNGK